MEEKKEDQKQFPPEQCIWIESVAKQEPEMVTPEQWKYLEYFYAVWEELSRVGGIEDNPQESNEGVHEKIVQYFHDFPGNKFYKVFDNAEDAFSFFKLFRTGHALVLLLQYRKDIESYAPSVQELCGYLWDMVKISPRAFETSSTLCLEMLLRCLYIAVQKKMISYQVLRKFHALIHELCMYQNRWQDILQKKRINAKISRSKQEQVNIRKSYLEEYERFLKEKQDSNKKNSQSSHRNVKN